MDNFLLDMSIYSVLLPLLTGLLLLKFQDANARIMVLLMAFASIPQLSSKLGFRNEERRILYNLYILVDVFLWGYLFYRITNHRLAKNIIRVLCLSLFALCVYTYISQGIERRFYSYLVSFNNVIQVICVLIYFYEKYYNDKIIRLVEDSMFWFCFGILVYAPLTYFMFAFRFYIPKVELEPWWKYHHIINTLLYVLITIGFLISLKKNKTLSNGY